MKKAYCLSLLAFGCLLLAVGYAGEPVPIPSYKNLISQGDKLFQAGKLAEAFATAQAAAKLDPKGYQAPALAALILISQKEYMTATTAINEALALAPINQRQKLQEIGRLIPSPPEPANPAALASNPPAVKLDSKLPLENHRRSNDSRVQGNVDDLLPATKATAVDDLLPK